MKSLVYCLPLAFVLSVSGVTAEPQDIAQREVRKIIAGVPVTGPNDRCGEPVWQMPAPFPIDFGFTTVGAYNDAGTEPLLLTSDLCAEPNQVLATRSSPELNALAGYFPPDPRTQNVPLHQVAVKSGPGGLRMPLAVMGETEGNPFPPVRVASSAAITTQAWLSSAGELTIACKNDGSAKFKAKFTDLIPNGVYSLIGTWKVFDPESQQYLFAALAFGGVPATVVSDHQGKASIARTLNYCPFEPLDDGSSLMFVDLGYHMDGASNGVLPSSFFQQDLFLDPITGDVYPSAKPPGVVTSPALGFPITVADF